VVTRTGWGVSNSFLLLKPGKTLLDHRTTLLRALNGLNKQHYYYDIDLRQIEEALRLNMHIEELSEL